jgi:hypothetical protein
MHPYKDPSALFLPAVALLLTLSGCVNLGEYGRPPNRNWIAQPSRPVPIQSASRDQSDQPGQPQSPPEGPNAMARTSLEGCLTVGAVAAIGANLLSEKGHRRRNAAIGGLLGCGAGVAANAYVQGQRRQYASNEDRLQAEIAKMRADNQRVAALIETTRQTISADIQHMTSLNAAYRTRQVSLADAQSRMRRIKANRDHLQQTLASLKGKEQSWRAVAASNRQFGNDTREMDQEIEALEKQISSLEQDLDLLDQQIRVSPVSG